MPSALIVPHGCEPSAPVGLVSEASSECREAASLVWQRPKLNGGLAIDGYQVYMQADDGTEWQPAEFVDAVVVIHLHQYPHTRARPSLRACMHARARTHVHIFMCNRRRACTNHTAAGERD